MSKPNDLFFALKNRFDQSVAGESFEDRLKTITHDYIDQQGQDSALLNRLVSTSSLLNIIEKDKQADKIDTQRYDREEAKFKKRLLNYIGSHCDEKLVFRKNMLFISANPWEYYQTKGKDGARIDIGISDEHEEIRSAIGSNSIIEIDERMSCTWSVLGRTLQYGGVEILHYSGHANEEGLVLQGDGGQLDFITTDRMGKLLDVLGRLNDLELVFLNACSTKEIVADLKNQFPKVHFIGYKGAVESRFAIAIGQAFYKSLEEHFNTKHDKRDAYKLAFDMIWLEAGLDSHKEKTIFL